MSYLGRGLEQVDNISKLDNITFNGGTTYALTKDSSAFQPISSNAILISVSGVIQQGNFSVSGTNIVFNTAVASSESCDFIMHYGTGVAFTPADNSITKDKTNFVSTSSSAGLQIKGDGTTDGTLQLNCSQNTHGVKIKSPAHSASQSYTLTLPTTAPASNKMLQTDGSGNLSFVDAPSGGLVYVGGANVSSSTTYIQVDNVFTSTYSNYLITYRLIPVTNGNMYSFQFRNSTPATLDAAEYEYSINGFDSSNSATFRDHTGRATTDLTHGINNDTSRGGLTGYMYIHEPDSGDRVVANIHHVYPNDSAVLRTGIGGMTYKNTGAAIAGFQFYGNGGTADDNTAQARIKVYGIVDS